MRHLLGTVLIKHGVSTMKQLLGIAALLVVLTAPLEAALASVVHDLVGLAIAPASLTVLEGTCKVRLVQ